VTADKVFVCHRRGDAVRQVGRLLEKLSHAFGEDTLYFGAHETTDGKSVSMDGLHAMIDARAVLIMIGPNWASLENLERLHETDGKPDPLRHWIAVALTRHGTSRRHAPMLLPILLDGASMPDKASLPKDLRALAKLTPLVVSSEPAQAHAQFEKLVTLLNGALGITPPGLPPLMAHLFKPITLDIAKPGLPPALIRLLKPIALTLAVLTGSVVLADWLDEQDAKAHGNTSARGGDRVVAAIAEGTPGVAE
jgi:hypothetical protein